MVKIRLPFYLHERMYHSMTSLVENNVNITFCSRFIVYYDKLRYIQISYLQAASHTAEKYVLKPQRHIFITQVVLVTRLRLSECRQATKGGKSPTKWLLCLHTVNKLNTLQHVPLTVDASRETDRYLLENIWERHTWWKDCGR